MNKYVRYDYITYVNFDPKKLCAKTKLQYFFSNVMLQVKHGADCVYVESRLKHSRLGCKQVHWM